MTVLSLIIRRPITVARKNLYHSLDLKPYLCDEEGLGVGVGAGTTIRKENEAGQTKITDVH